MGAGASSVKDVVMAANAQPIGSIAKESFDAPRRTFQDISEYDSSHVCTLIHDRCSTPGDMGCYGPLFQEWQAAVKARLGNIRSTRRKNSVSPSYKEEAPVFAQGKRITTAQEFASAISGVCKKMWGALDDADVKQAVKEEIDAKAELGAADDKVEAASEGSPVKQEAKEEREEIVAKVIEKSAKTDATLKKHKRLKSMRGQPCKEGFKRRGVLPYACIKVVPKGYQRVKSARDAKRGRVGRIRKSCGDGQRRSASGRCSKAAGKKVRVGPNGGEYVMVTSKKTGKKYARYL